MDFIYSWQCALNYCFRCQRLFLAKSSPHTASDGLRPDGLPGVEPMIALSKGQADGMCDNVDVNIALATSHNFYIYLDLAIIVYFLQINNIIRA